MINYSFKSFVIWIHAARSLLVIGFICFRIAGHAQEHTYHGDGDDSVMQDMANKRASDDDQKKKTYFLDSYTYRESDSAHKERNVPSAVIHNWKSDDDFWYATAEIKRPKKRTKTPIIQDEPFFQQTWFQTLLWLIIIGAFAGVLIWYLAESKVGIFRRKSHSIGNTAEQESNEDIFAINYQKEIDAAVRQQNYRLAVRLMFLRLLKDLSERKIIQYTQDRTNFDYLLQLHSTQYYNDFFRLTRNYEFSWYGQFDVDETVFRSVQNEFNQFNKQLK